MLAEAPAPLVKAEALSNERSYTSAVDVATLFSPVKSQAASLAACTEETHHTQKTATMAENFLRFLV